MKPTSNKISHLKLLCSYFILGIILYSCSGDDDLLSGDIKVSRIKNMQEYKAPLVIEKGNVSNVTINGENIDFVQGIYELDNAGFYEMVIEEVDTTVFVLISTNRIYDGDVYSEWGLPERTPSPIPFSEKIDGELEIIKPSKYIEGIEIPFVVSAKGWNTKNDQYAQCELLGKSFNLKRGIGSVSVILNNESTLNLRVGNQTLSTTIVKNEVLPTVLVNKISEKLVLGKNSVYRVADDVNITSTGSLILEEGVILLIDEGVNFINSGPIEFNGTRDNPILVTCSSPNKYFGGFISERSSSKILAKHTFFARFSFHKSEEYQYGHANHQALFKGNNTSQKFESCFFFDSPGQVLFPRDCDIDISNSIIQRVKTTGQFNSTNTKIENSYFSDFPNDDLIFQDDDNDGLYLNQTNAHISNSMFMYTKDDGIDSGGNEGGEVTIDNCVFEACMHEGLALSSVSPATKLHTISNCLITNCQQGVELGFSSENHSVIIDNCEISNNYIGVRYGDNYDRSIEGKVTVKNSTIKNNKKNSWNMVRKFWLAFPERLVFENTKLE
ncbi:MAG: right-handed parallel beta-helix repeat-containing protein [Prolixibacteraceae bacterium]|nr:right-handed parallel beta-helix repeat-containing protein [Prolixibacteraceae bacterium]